MDTQTFLQRILPATGFKFVTEWLVKPRHPRGGVMVHYPVADIDDMVDKVREIDSRHNNAYFAMATYKEVKHETIKTQRGDDFTYVVGRTQDNAQNVKSLWMDWDVGKSDAGMSYATRKEALEGVKAYVAATNLPDPMVVSSGYGLHTYWCFTDEIPAAEWERVACLQRVIMRHLQIKFDPSRDKDCSSILRPAGSHNYKAGKEPQSVKVLLNGAAPLPAQEYRRILQGYIEQNELTSQALVPSYMQSGRGNLADFGAADYPESFADIAAQHCNQLAEFSKTGGTSEPLWFVNLGLIKFFVDGEKWAHEWSAKHPEYDYAHTQMKMDQWSKGPTSCQTFKEKNPEGCVSCAQKCTSPIQLGYNHEVETPQIPVVTQEVQAPLRCQPEAPPKKNPDVDGDTTPFGWPEGFGYDAAADKVYAKVKNPETQVWEHRFIASPLFYPTDMIFLEDGTHVFRLAAHIRGRVRQFEIPTKSVADKRTLRTALAGCLITVLDDNLTSQFMNKYMTNLRNQKEVVETYSQFGWKHDYQGFLIGNKMVTALEVKTVEISRENITSPELLASFRVEGTVADWVADTNYLYNRENSEPFQFAFGLAFGAILSPLVADPMWRGIPYALTSRGTAYGKSTAVRHALNIYGDVDKFCLTKFTPLALPIRLSNMGHMPTLFDEITTSLPLPYQMSDALYTLSHGQMKAGGTTAGRERNPLPPWNVPSFLTSNRNIESLLGENKDIDPEAARMRVFEVDVEYYKANAHMLLPDGKDVADRLMRTHGAVGVEWIRFVIRNRKVVEEALRAVFAKVHKALGVNAGAERFYCHLITTAYVGLYFARKLGFLHFDPKAVMQWALAHADMLRMQRSTAANTSEDHFSHMMADMIGRLLVTKKYSTADARSNTAGEHPIIPIHGPVEGRLALGIDGEKPRLILTRRAVTTWCAENGVPFQAFKRELMEAKVLRTSLPGVDMRTGVVRAALGKGVVGYTQLGAAPCLEFDPEAGARAVSPHTETVIRLHAG